eukprot:6480461-Alexandrium_andersonii.AAC.1
MPSRFRCWCGPLRMLSLALNLGHLLMAPRKARASDSLDSQVSAWGLVELRLAQVAPWAHLGELARSVRRRLLERACPGLSEG